MKKEEIDFANVPFNYPMCLNEQCPKANTCLRQLTAQSIPATTEIWPIVNPKFLSTLKGECPHYRSSRKERYAKGFIKMLEALPYTQMRTAISLLLGHFGRGIYYRIRKGERLLTSSEQQSVLNILRRCGVTQPQEFDEYIEDYLW